MTIRVAFALIVLLCGCSQYRPVPFNKKDCEGLTPAIVATDVKRIVDPLYLESEWSLSSNKLKAVRLQVEAALALVEKCGNAERYQVKPGASAEEIFLAHDSMDMWIPISDGLGGLILVLRRSENAPFFIFGRSLWKSYYSDYFKNLTIPSSGTR